MTLTSSAFTYICTLLRERSGIALEAGKEYLVDARLTPLARQEGCASLGELVGRLRAASFNSLHQKVIEAMTTNETSFFRDVHPFEVLRTIIIPELLERRAAARTLHLWCAACSSGQEPYSMAMLLRHSFPELAPWTLRFVVSDLSSAMLQRARTGCFSQLEINRGLPVTMLVKYFKKQGLTWQINEELRQMLDFRKINLTAAWPPLPQMDLIFMRNVLIYFDMETKKAILARVRQLLRPDGYLFLGGAETTMRLDDAFERLPMHKTSCYRLRAS